MISENQVEGLINEHYRDTEKFLVDVIVKPVNRISVFIDGDRGVNIHDCRELSKFIGSRIDRDQEDYDLTVSSAGADKPIMLPRQFLKHVGREMEVKTNEGILLSGKLIHADANSIELEHISGKKQPKKPNTGIIFSEIKEAKVKLSFK
ncbi:MAG: ribosome assembly cofactor RimP [Bacteroidetes bacterium]|nr:ribosome assembly cofactor RimP [Bacteroidota bacterium]